MKLTASIGITLSLLLLFAWGCSEANQADKPENDEMASGVTNAIQEELIDDHEEAVGQSDGSTVAAQLEDGIPGGDYDSHADAYYVVFQYVLEFDSWLKHDVKYIALDLSEMTYEMPDRFIRLAESYCDRYGCTLLLDDMGGLVEKGYMRGYTFEAGYIVSFRDIAFTDETITIEGEKWRSFLGANGGTFTLEKNNGTWEILHELSSGWIS